MGDFSLFELEKFSTQLGKYQSEKSSRERQNDVLENHFKDFIKLTERTSPNLDLVCIREFFDYLVLKCIKHNFAGIKPYLIPKRLENIIVWARVKKDFELKSSEAFDLRTYARKSAKAIAGDTEMLGTKQATPITLKQGLKLAEDMRYNYTKRSAVNAPVCALLFKLMLLTGSRMSDLIRVKWKDISISLNAENKACLTIKVLQKTNPLGERNDRKTIFLSSKQKYNPLFWLHEDSKGKLSSDFLFENKKGEVLSGDNFRYQLKLAAQRINLPFIPTGHSARTAMCSTLSLANATDEQIKIFLNWGHDSAMPNYYKRHLLEKSSLGCAKIFYDLLEDDKIDALQDQIDQNQ